jgi:hypothetical protein
MSAAILTARKASVQVGPWLGALLVAYFFARLLILFGPTLTFAFLVTVAIFLGVLVRPAYGALALAAGVPALSGMRRGLPVPGLRPSEVLIALVATAVLLALATRTDHVYWTAFDWLALLYVVGTFGLGTFDLIRRGDPFTLTAIGDLLGPLQFFLMYRAVIGALRTTEWRLKALKYILLTSIPVSILGIAQSLNVGPARSLVRSLTGVDFSSVYGYQNIPRATGPFPIWHALGGYLFLVLLLGVALYLDHSTEVMSRRWLTTTLAFTSAGLIATATIAPIAGAFLGALVLGFWSKRVSKLFVGLAVMGVVLLLVFSPLLTSRYDQQFGPDVAMSNRPDYIPQTLWSRYLIWDQQYAPALAEDDRWLIGYGPGVPVEVDWQYTETLYITLIMRGGVVLLGIYVALMLMVAARARRLARSEDPSTRAIARVVYLSIILMAFMHLVANYFVISGFPHLLWPLLGLLFAPAPRTSPAAARATPGSQSKEPAKYRPRALGSSTS